MQPIQANSNVYGDTNLPGTIPDICALHGLGHVAGGRRMIFMNMMMASQHIHAVFLG